jgi:hypothetical protein
VEQEDRMKGKVEESVEDKGMKIEDGVDKDE